MRRFEVATPPPGQIGRRARVATGLVYRPSIDRALAREVARARSDVVHFHNLMPMLTPAAMRGARRAGAAVVLTVHNYRLFCPGGTLMSRGMVHDSCVDGSSLRCALRNPRGAWPESLAYGVALEVHRRLRLVQRWVDAYIVPSAHMRDLLVRAGFPTERIHAVAHGVPRVCTPREKAGFSLYAGRLAEEKGVLTLLKAARSMPDVPLVIAGDGPLRSLVEKESIGSVTYVGPLDQATLSSYRSRAAFALVPSECPEALGLVAVESLAHGLPTITTTCGGLAGIAANGGCVTVEAGNARELASAMKRLWVDGSERERLRVDALRAARVHYDLARQTHKVLALYERCAATRHRSP